MSADYEKRDSIYLLKEENLDKFIKEPEHKFVMVNYYAHFSEDCKKFEPIYD